MQIDTEALFRGEGSQMFSPPTSGDYNKAAHLVKEAGQKTNGWDVPHEQADCFTSRAGQESTLLQWELSSVTSEAVVNDRSRGHDDHSGVDSEPLKRQALAALLASLRPSQRITFVHRFDPNAPVGPKYHMALEGLVCHHHGSAQAELSAALQREITSFLRTGYPEYGFSLKEEPWRAEPRRSKDVQSERRVLIPAHLQLNSQQIGFSSELRGVSRVRLPVLKQSGPACLLGAMSALMASTKPTELRIEFSGRVITADVLRDIRTMLARLGEAVLVQDGGTTMQFSAPSASGLDTLRADSLVWAQWLLEPVGADMRVIIESEGEPSSVLIHLAGRDILQGRPYTIIKFEQDDGPESAKDVSTNLSYWVPANCQLPPVFPRALLLHDIGLAKGTSFRLAVPELPSVQLGLAPSALGDQKVCLRDLDRLQHCYVVGATGTGKSTLLHSMIAQDIERGHGVVLFDPHGDLYQQILGHIPQRRAKDVVLLDFTNPDLVPGMNILQLTSAHKDIESNSIIRDLSAILLQLYRGIPESMGPIFFLYMRNVLALLLAAPGGTCTLLDVPRVLADRAFRNFLIAQCQDKQVVEFWKGIALQASGDHGLKELAPYIVSKFTEFTQNAIVRRVVGQAQSTFEFGSMMNERKVVLVNLAKGMLNDLDSSFLGMLLTGKLFRDASRRCAVPLQERIPCFVYLDEFQNLTSEALGTALAEGRKYGLALTLAHQDSMQVSQTLKTSLWTNAASKVLFRLGPHDAKELQNLTEPLFSANDLSSLPDRQAVVRLKSETGITPALTIQVTSYVDSQKVTANPDQVSALRLRSREAYCHSALAIDQAIEANRWQAPEPAAPELQKVTEGKASYKDLMRQVGALE